MAETRPARKSKQTVLAVSADRTWLQSLVRALSAVPEIEPKAVDMAAFLDGKFDRGAVDAIVMDIDDGAALRDERLFSLRQDLGKAPMVVLSGQLPHDLARQLVRLGSTDWLQKPLELRQIVDAVTPMLRVKVAGGNKVFAVMSCVGGAGGTSLSIVAAHTIARQMGSAPDRCALVDLDFTKGSCGIYLDVQNDVELASFVDNPQRVDAEFMDLVRRDYRDRFAVFSFARPDLSYARNGEEFVLRMMDVLAFQFRNTVIDIPFHYTPWRDRILEAADGVMLVTELTIPSVRQAQLVLEGIRPRRTGAGGVAVVVNRHRSKLFSRAIGHKDLVKTFEGASVHYVPDDWSTLQDAINRGIAAPDAGPRSAFVKKAAAPIAKMLAREKA